MAHGPAVLTPARCTASPADRLHAAALGAAIFTEPDCSHVLQAWGSPFREWAWPDRETHGSHTHEGRA